MGEDLAWIVVAILFVWSCALIWASIQIRYMLRTLAEERRELRRWKRIETLAKRQNWPDDYYR